MVTAREVSAEKLIPRLKEELKKVEQIQPPEWVKFVKSGAHRERPPQQDDFWYIRAASVLRRIYLDGPVGTERLRSYYGGRKNLGHQPSHFRKAGGKIIRTGLQQLEELGFIHKDKKGRVITPKGQSYLTKKANELRKKLLSEGKLKIALPMEERQPETPPNRKEG